MPLEGGGIVDVILYPEHDMANSEELESAVFDEGEVLPLLAEDRPMDSGDMMEGPSSQMEQVATENVENTRKVKLHMLAIVPSGWTDPTSLVT